MINVIEAIHHNQCSDNYLIIGHFNIFPDRIKQLKQLLKDPFIRKNFKKIYFLPSYFNAKSPFRFLDYFFGYVVLFFIFFRVKKIDCFFSGVYTDLYQRPANFLALYFNPSVNLVIIDEGVRILTDVVDRNEAMLNATYGRTNSLKLKNLFFAIQREWHPPVLQFFSMYDLPVSQKDTLIKNTFAYWRKNNPYVLEFENDAVVIIGQPLAELNVISKKTYQEYIFEILNQENSQNIYYFPHPMENYHMDLIPDQIKVINNLMPTELLLMTANIKSLVGFNSTVLYNAAILKLCSDIKSFWINPADYIQQPNLNAMRRMLEKFQKANIEIINL